MVEKSLVPLLALPQRLWRGLPLGLRPLALGYVLNGQKDYQFLARRSLNLPGI